MIMNDSAGTPGNGPTDSPALPQGPALLYVHSDAGFGVLRPERTVTQVDLSLPVGGGPVSDAEARRERQILRGLLEHALWLLDQYDRGNPA